MGMDLDAVYQRGAWLKEVFADEPYLSISIHDSDFAEVRHAPTSAIGLCYLGTEPRFYFDDPDQNQPVDPTAEADSLARWARIQTGASVAPDQLIRLLASPDGEDPVDDVVEDTVRELLSLLGLPLPPDLE